MKECFVETGDVGEYISSLCWSSAMPNEPRCLDSLGSLETKNKFLARGLECLVNFSFVLSRSLTSAGRVGFEYLMLELLN